MIEIVTLSAVGLVLAGLLVRAVRRASRVIDLMPVGRPPHPPPRVQDPHDRTRRPVRTTTSKGPADGEH